MEYADGTIAELGDYLDMGLGDSGTVVAIMEEEAYSDGVPQEQWGYLKEGALVDTNFGGIIWYTRFDDDPSIVFVSRVEDASSMSD
ncbi:MAG: hypothetical protein JW722_08305 [Demequinaceae bacterium]|nr:hypothetical protein [Demequinaceae bacterium]